MSRLRLVVPVLFLGFLLGPLPAHGQIGDLVKDLKEEVEDTKDGVVDAKETVKGVNDIRCEMGGPCGDVTRAEHFTPGAYETLAVTVFDGTRFFANPGIQGIVQHAFESALVERGYLLAAAADSRTIQEMISKENKRRWSDADLAQIQDLVDNIDATLVVEIRQLDRELCQPEEGQYGSLARVHLTARWLNVDAGDVPWVGEHSAEVCAEGRGEMAGTEALQTAAKQLASALPSRETQQ